MTAFGFVFMVTSLVFVWGLTFWCFKKVLTAPDDDGHVVKPPDTLGG